MDERIQAGRHHLLNGERALALGYPADSRAHYEAALLRFRGPDLRIGEGHALRGLAQVAMATGNVRAAESHLRDAITCYQAVHALLDRVDGGDATLELRRDAQEGEAVALVLLAEVSIRTGRIQEAREALDFAREIYHRLGDRPSAASMWAAIARLALHEASYERAAEAFDRALAIQAKGGDVAGQCGIWLSIAELRRLERDIVGTEQALAKARAYAREAGNPALEGRVLAALGSLLLQTQRLRDAERTYTEALALVRQGGDGEMEAWTLLGLGEVQCRLGDNNGIDSLLDGARIFASLEHHLGVGSALLRMGEHGLRLSEAEFALACAEGARRIFRRADPVRGVGQALRVVVKALAKMKQWQAAYVAALAREGVAGTIQPNARDVANWYRERAPADWTRAVSGMDVTGLVTAAQQITDAILLPVLTERIGTGTPVLDTLSGALSVAEVLSGKLPRPADPEEWEEPVTYEGEIEPFMEAGPGAPPEEQPEATEEVVIVAPPPTASTAPGEYDALYDPPAPAPAEPAPSGDFAAEAPVPDELAKAPPPAEYAGLYDPPADEAKEKA